MWLLIMFFPQIIVLFSSGYSIKLYFKLYLNFTVLLFKFMLFIKKNNLNKLYLFHMLLILKQ